MYGTPLDELDIFCHWAADVKEQHYAQLPAPDPVANTLGAKSAKTYYLPRGDLDPCAFEEFEPMVNSTMPWLGGKLARAEEVRGVLDQQKRKTSPLRHSSRLDFAQGVPQTEAHVLVVAGQDVVERQCP